MKKRYIELDKYDCVKVIGKMDHTLDNTYESANRVYKVYGSCPTIPTCAGGNIQPKIIRRKQMNEKKEPEYGIRKLIPTECGRLMGVSDEDIAKMLTVNSNSQCYKQFGNSIIVDVLCAIFSQLHIQGIKTWNEIH